MVVKTITPGGSAFRNGNLRVGDHFFQIGEINVRSMSSEQIASILRQMMQTQRNNLVKFIVARPIRELFKTPKDAINILNQNTDTLKIVETRQISDNKTIDFMNLVAIGSKENLDNGQDLIKLSPNDSADYIEFYLERSSNSQAFGVSITSFMDSNKEIFYVKELVKDSIADKLNKIEIYDEIVEINNKLISNLNSTEITTTLSNDLNIKLKLRRSLKRVHEILELKWSKLFNKNQEILIDEIDKLNTSCLGISLEGTVDIVNDEEKRSHHYIRSILKDGPVDKCKRFKDGDELLEIDGHVLYNISYLDLLDILKNLPMRRMTIVCVRSNDKKVEVEVEPIIPPVETKTTTNNLNNSNQLLTMMNKIPLAPGRTPPLRSRSLEMNGLAMWNTKLCFIDLNKTDKGLGFSIIDYHDPFNSLNNAIVIRSLVPHGAAQIDGRLLPGYRLVSVNDISVERATLEFAVKCLKEAPKGVVRLGIQKPLPFPYSINELSNKTKSEACVIKINNKEEEEEEDEILNEKINETIKLLNNKRNEMSVSKYAEEDEYGCVATSAPAILTQDFRTHYNNFEINKFAKNKLFKTTMDLKVFDEDTVKVIENDISSSSDIDDFFSNVNSNYPDDGYDYDDNATDSTNTSCASSNSIKSSVANTPISDKEEQVEECKESAAIKSIDNQQENLDFDKHEYGEFVYSYENIRFLVSFLFFNVK